MKIAANFIAIVLLIGLIATPIYFAQKFAKVAGVKSASKYLIVSQIDKFPNLTFSQNGDRYTITYQKYGESQAFLGILIINNPTANPQNYRLEKLSGEDTIFFGEDLDDQITQISAPSQTSVPISLFSENGQPLTQSVEFTIKVD